MTFIPQIESQDKEIINSIDTDTYEVPIGEVTNEKRLLVEDCSRDTDHLRNHENAPDRAGEWPRMYEVTIDKIW